MWCKPRDFEGLAAAGLRRLGWWPAQTNPPQKMRFSFLKKPFKPVLANYRGLGVKGQLQSLRDAAKNLGFLSPA